MPTARLALAVLLLASGCSLEKMTVDQTAAVLADGSRAFDSETDPELARQAIPASLKTMESFLEAHPEQPILLRLLAEAYTNYAFGFIEDEAERLQDENPKAADELRSRALNYYLRARGYGLRLLALDHEDLAAALAKGQLPQGALSELTADDVPALFWIANPWSAAINVGKQDPALVAQLPLVHAIVARAAELDATYFHAGPLMTLGALAASVPPALGGQPKLAQKYFEQAIAATHGNFLMISVLYAKTALVQLGDKQAYVATLEKVLATDPDADPQMALANRLAQRRAQRYLAAADDLFFE